MDSNNSTYTNFASQLYQFPIIWQLSHPEFNDQLLRRDALFSLSRIFGCPVADVLQNIESLMKTAKEYSDTMLSCPGTQSALGGEIQYLINEWHIRKESAQREIDCETRKYSYIEDIVFYLVLKFRFGMKRSCKDSFVDWSVIRDMVNKEINENLDLLVVYSLWMEIVQFLLDCSKKVNVRYIGDNHVVWEIIVQLPYSISLDLPPPHLARMNKLLNMFNKHKEKIILCLIRDFGSDWNMVKVVVNHSNSFTDINNFEQVWKYIAKELKRITGVRYVSTSMLLTKWDAFVGSIREKVVMYQQYKFYGKDEEARQYLLNLLQSMVINTFPMLLEVPYDKRILLGSNKKYKLIKYYSCAMACLNAPSTNVPVSKANHSQEDCNEAATGKNDSLWIDHSDVNKIQVASEHGNILQTSTEHSLNVAETQLAHDEIDVTSEYIRELETECITDGTVEGSECLEDEDIRILIMNWLVQVPEVMMSEGLVLKNNSEESRLIFEYMAYKFEKIGLKMPAVSIIEIWDEVLERANYNLFSRNSNVDVSEQSTEMDWMVALYFPKLIKRRPLPELLIHTNPTQGGKTFDNTDCPSLTVKSLPPPAVPVAQQQNEYHFNEEEEFIDISQFQYCLHGNNITSGDNTNLLKTKACNATYKIPENNLVTAKLPNKKNTYKCMTKTECIEKSELNQNVFIHMGPKSSELHENISNNNNLTLNDTAKTAPNVMNKPDGQNIISSASTQLSDGVLPLSMDQFSKLPEQYNCNNNLPYKVGAVIQQSAQNKSDNFNNQMLKPTSRWKRQFDNDTLSNSSL